MADPSKWDWADTVSGVLLGIFGGVVTMYGWFSHKIDAMHGRISSVKQTVNDHNASIKVLEANYTATLQRLDSIEDNSKAINKKQDQQMAILLDIQRAGHNQPRRGQ